MAELTVRLIGDDILRKRCKEVKKFDESLKVLSEDMIETMHIKNGIGLAASQVGRLKRMIVVDIYDETGPKVFVNPEIMTSSGSEIAFEGCLSIPDETGAVERAYKISFKYNDLSGKELELEVEGLFARVVQHEIDHLNGVLFIDKVIEGYEAEDE